MSAEEFRRHAHAVVDWIAGYLDDPERFAVLPAVRPGDVARALPVHAPAEGEPFDALLADFERLIAPATTHWNHPGFFGYFATSGSAPGTPSHNTGRTAPS